MKKAGVEIIESERDDKEQCKARLRKWVGTKTET